jgi:hypothetical protein
MDVSSTNGKMHAKSKKKRALKCTDHDDKESGKVHKLKRKAIYSKFATLEAKEKKSKMDCTTAEEDEASAKAERKRLRNEKRQAKEEKRKRRAEAELLEFDHSIAEKREEDGDQIKAKKKKKEKKKEKIEINEKKEKKEKVKQMNNGINLLDNDLIFNIRIEIKNGKRTVTFDHQADAQKNNSCIKSNSSEVDAMHAAQVETKSAANPDDAIGQLECEHEVNLLNSSSDSELSLAVDISDLFPDLFFKPEAGSEAIPAEIQFEEYEGNPCNYCNELHCICNQDNFY